MVLTMKCYLWLNPLNILTISDKTYTCFPGVEHHPMRSFLGLGGSIPVTLPRPKYDPEAHDFKQHMWSY